MAPKARTANIQMLESMKMRSFLASKMMYEQSTRYSNYAFWAVMVASGLMGLAAANLCENLPLGDDQNILVSASKMLIGVVSGFTVSFQTGKTFLIDYFEKKQRIYNETASGWQKLELDIELFLNCIKATDKEMIQFTRECIKQRDDICSKSKPEEDIYQKYHKNPDLVIKKYRQKHSVIESIQKELAQEEKAKAEHKEDEPDLVCWACLPFGVYYCIFYRVAEIFVKHVNESRCMYHREHFI